MFEASSFIAGALCLDFANTVAGRGSSEQCDHLSDHHALLEWARAAGLLSEQEQRRSSEEAARRPRQAAATHRRALALREAIYGVFSPIAAGRKAPALALEAVNRALARGHARVETERSPGRYRIGWRLEGAGAADRMLASIAWSAAELLTDPELLGRARECAGERCGWLFLDTTRNRSRRWCDMRVCGNRAKMRRYLARHKAAPAR